MEEKIKEILKNHYSEMLSELEEVLDTDDVELFIEIKNDDFHCRLG
jgi:hypothetical protein